MSSSLAIIKCSGDPLINIAGAYFPAWLVCMIVGVVGSWTIGRLLYRFKFSSVLHPASLMISALFAAITLWFWVFYFSAR